MTDEQFVIMEEHTRDILERLIKLEHTVAKMDKELQRIQLVQINGGI